MNTGKIYKIPAAKIIQLIESIGSCVASDKITVNGELVGYMYREEPDFETDSGWRFFSGHESQDYVDNPENLAIYNVNTIVNYDEAIVPFLNLPIGSELVRTKEDTVFQIIKT
jgi:hypothetical protein